MRILILLLIAFSTYGQCNCDFTVTGDQVLDGVKMGVKPGQTVCFKMGTYSWLYVQNFKGEPGKPITFINECGGKVIFKRGDDGQRIVWAINDQFIRWTGTGNPNEFYGFEFIGGGQGIDFRDRSSDIEFDHCYGHDIGYSFFNAKTDPVCGRPETQRGGFTMYNIYYHDNKAVNIRTGEAAYVGESHYASGFKASCGTLQEHDVIGVRFINNIFQNIGRDAIQIGSTIKDCVIQYNKVTNFGMTKEYGQASGIQANPGTNAIIEDNVIDGGSSFGIILQGRMGTIVRRNLVMNTAGGILAVARENDAGAFLVENNTFLNLTGNGVEYYSNTNFRNNILHMKSGTLIKRYGGTLTDADNLKAVGDIAQLKLDANYVPLEGSPARGVVVDAGAFQSVKVTHEAGSLDVQTTNGLIEIFVITPGGKRIKIQ